MIVAAVSMVLVGCGNKNGGSGDKQYKIGILQLVEHPALDAATEGFKEALEKKLGKDNVKFDEQNAQGDDSNCATIAGGFVNDRVDLILANATPALQACANATSDIPIIGTSVTDFGAALDIKDFDGKTGKNVTGTSDLVEAGQYVDLIKECAPDVKQIGILYCSKEANSKVQVESMSKALDEAGIKYKDYAAADSNEIQSVTTKAAGECDVFYIPTDNTMASATETIKNVVLDKKIPVIAGEEGLCSGCGVVTVSISYKDLGYRAGEMAAEILQDGKNAGEMDVETQEELTKLYNKEVAEKIGLKVPDGYEELAA